MEKNSSNKERNIYFYKDLWKRATVSLSKKVNDQNLTNSPYIVFLLLYKPLDFF